MAASSSLARNGQALDLGDRRRVDQELRSQQPRELAQVELGHEHALVARQHLAEVRTRRGAGARAGRARRRCRPARSRETAASIAPSVEPHPTTSVVAVPLGSSTTTSGIVSADPCDAVVAQPRHPLVVRRVVGDRALVLGLLEPADAVLEARAAPAAPRGARASPRRARTARTSRCRRRRCGSGADAKPGSIRGIESHVGDQPRLGAVREVGVGEQDHRRAVGDRDAHRLEGGVEAVARRLGRDDRQRRLAVPPVHREQEVGLLDLGGQARRGSAALHVDDEQRQLQADREADRLALEVDARTARRRHPERAAVARADRRGDRGDLVLGLERPDAELLALGELVEDVGGRA